MLPGLRFIAATIVLSISILIFGFGAAALLRANHEEFANLKTIRPTQPQIFAQTSDKEQPAITLMQVETVAEQPPPPQDIGLTASENAKVAAVEANKVAAENAKVASIDPQGTAEIKVLVPDPATKAQPVKRRARRAIHRRRVIVQTPTQQPAPNTGPLGLLNNQ